MSTTFCQPAQTPKTDQLAFVVPPVQQADAIGSLNQGLLRGHLGEIDQLALQAGKHDKPSNQDK